MHCCWQLTETKQKPHQVRQQRRTWIDGVIERSFSDLRRRRVENDSYFRGCGLFSHNSMMRHVVPLALWLWFLLDGIKLRVLLDEHTFVLFSPTALFKLFDQLFRHSSDREAIIFRPLNSSPQQADFVVLVDLLYRKCWTLAAFLLSWEIFNCR